MTEPRPLPPGATMRIIRVGFLGGVVVFGAVVTFLVGRDGPLAPETAAVLQIMNIVIVVAAALGILYIQRKHAGEREPAAITSLTIAGWACGEVTAIFGAVHYLMVGSPIPYLVGLGMMLASFAMVPIRE